MSKLRELDRVIATTQPWKGAGGGSAKTRYEGLRFPGNHQMPNNTHVRFYWFDTPEPFQGNCLPPPLGTCTPIAVCGLLGAEILTDEGTATLQVSCPAFATTAGSKVFSISAYACQTHTGECTKKLDISNLDVWNSVCRRPPCCEEGCGGCAVGGGAGRNHPVLRCRGTAASGSV